MGTLSRTPESQPRVTTPKQWFTQRGICHGYWLAAVLETNSSGAGVAMPVVELRLNNRLVDLLEDLLGLRLRVVVRDQVQAGLSGSSSVHIQLKSPCPVEQLPLVWIPTAQRFTTAMAHPAALAKR